MFALEFLNFAYNVKEFSAKYGVFDKGPYSVIKPSNGINAGFSGGIIPGDIYGGAMLRYNKISLEVMVFRSGDILITSLRDTAKPPEVVDRINFWAGKMGAYINIVNRDYLFGGINAFVLYARAGKYGWGSGTGFGVFGGMDFGKFEIFTFLKNALTSPVVWSTGKKEFALPEIDSRVCLKVSRYIRLITGISVSPDGRGFVPSRDGYVSVAISTGMFDAFGGIVEGFPRLGTSFSYGRYSVSLGSSYHGDFGFSFRGDVSFGF